MIFVVSHKDLAEKPVLIEGYRPFFVGSKRERLCIPGAIIDGSGDNIADLNSSFCELTALYWVWRNCDDSLKGVVHYRRFFEDENNRRTLISLSTANNELMESDIILPRKYWLLDTVEKHYASHHDAWDLKLCREVIGVAQPNYLNAFDECMGLRYIYPYNMLIASAETYDSYCAWLFSIMFELKERMDCDYCRDRDAYQSRVYGFLSERLMNVYVTGSGLAVRELPVFLTERSLKCSISMRLASLLYSKK